MLITPQLHKVRTRWVLALSLVVGLAGCGPQKNAVPESLDSRVETLELRPPGCASADDCASVTIRREVFADQPALNDAIYAQLRAQLQGNGEASAAPLDSLDKVAQKFLDDAAAGPADSAARWQLTGDAKQLGRYGNLLTVAINSYMYTGGAHGMPVSHWLNWDLASGEEVTLKDVIQPGQEAVFWKLAEEAHQQWLDTQETNDDFRQNWPFAQTEDFRLTAKGLTLLYGVYTLGPYAMGEVELMVPREKLAAVVRDDYLAASGNSNNGN